MEILIEFGGDIGAPNGRDQYTRMGHIEILGYDGIDYGLNSQGANWTASSTTGDASNYATIGLPEPKEMMHHMNNVGYKWYKCKLNSIYNIKSIAFYSGGSAGNGTIYYKDFPLNIKISVIINGDVIKTQLDRLDVPTAMNQRNKIINLDVIFIRNLIKSNNQIYTFDNNEWMNTNLIEPLSKQDFETNGITNLQPLLESKTIKNKTLEYQRDLESGKVYSLGVNRSEIPIVEKIEVL